MQNLLIAGIAVSPVLALISGLFLTPWIVALAAVALVRMHMIRVPGAAAGAAGTDERPLFSRNLRPVFFFLLLFLPFLSLLWTPEPAKALSMLLRLIVVIAAGWMVVKAVKETAVTERQRRFLLWGCIAAAALAAIETATGGIFIPRILFLCCGRTYFAMEDLNRGACALAVMAWPAFAAIPAKAGGIRLSPGMWIPAFAGMVLYVLSFLPSASAMLGMLTGCVAYIIASRWPEAAVKASHYALLSLLALVPLAALSVPYWRDFLPADMPLSWEHRLHIWHFAARKALEQPWLGWGFDASRHLSGGAAEFAPGLDLLPAHPHNVILQVWLELGAAGLAVAGWGISRVMAIGAWIAPISLAALWSYVTIAMTGFGAWQEWWIATGLIAVAAGRICYSPRARGNS